MKYRHKARRLAMQALCCLDAQGTEAMDLAASFIREGRDGIDVLMLAQQMLTEAWDYHEQADRRIAWRSEQWDVSRMPVVDRNILRLAVWELSTADSPAAVVINEAVRLAKEFSTDKSPRFINGILDTLAKADPEAEAVEIAEAEAKAAAEAEAAEAEAAAAEAAAAEAAAAEAIEAAEAATEADAADPPTEGDGSDLPDFSDPSNSTKSNAP